MKAAGSLSHLKIPGILSFLMVAVLYFSDPTSAVAETKIPDWKDDTVNTGVWEALPGEDGIYAILPEPTGASVDPFVYEYRVACAVADTAIFPACANNMITCDAAAGGVAIYWYRSPRTANPPSWQFDSGPACIYSERPRDILAEIAAQIAHEFEQLPVSPAVVGSQPGPHTLRGNDTNLYAQATEQTFNITLLGQQVSITATPVAYTWDYGDGTSWGPTPSSGAPLPLDRVGEQTTTSHAYSVTGPHIIVVTTHFDGRYSVNGGPSLPIPAQGHITSAPLGLTVWKAITRNYADNCLVNPAGVGC